MSIKINKTSVSKEDYQIFADKESGNIIAVKGENVKKIQEAFREFKKEENIPAELTVAGRLLGKNKNEEYEDNSLVLHTYKIKNLKFASSKIDWV